MPGRKGQCRIGCAAALLILATTPTLAAGQQPASLQTLCVLDFHRLGDDPRSDWLQQGLADLMIAHMGSLSPYLVLERRHLREILTEHGLVASGVVDPATAIRGAGLAKAQLMIQGSFARQGDQLAIQVRLIRLADQRMLAQATWSDRHSEVLSAPRALSEKLLQGQGQAIAPDKVEGLEHLVPTTIDEARSYYLGIGAFDAGRYAEALAHYLDAARQLSRFRQAHPSVLEMYYLLDRSDHALLFARDTARALDARGDATGAVEYYFAAAREAFGPLNDQRTARAVLEKLLQVVDRQESRTREIARTRREVLDRIAVSTRTDNAYPGRLLDDREIRERVWTGDIEAEITRRAEEQARGGSAVLVGGNWIKRPVPEPTLLMWKIRALGAMARVHADLGEIENALDRYRDVLEEYEFLAPHLPADGRLLSSIKTEAHFMTLRHYATTGRLIRDHEMNRINHLNVISHRTVFRRDFRNPQPDSRARVASRFDGRGYEYFDFAAPPGHQIDSVTMRADVGGIAELDFDLPNPAGRPPQYSLSSRLTRFKFSSAGEYTRTIVPPAGTELLSLGTAWGPGLLSNTREEVERWQQNPPPGDDLARWEITFTVSRKKAIATASAPASVEIEPVVRTVIDRYSAGWDRASVVRDAETHVYSGAPRLDVYAEDWFVFALNGDIRIFRQSDPRTEVGLPVTINSRDREFDPSLVRAGDGHYALFWARGTSRTNAARFVSFSSDLVRWETPQRLVFDQPPTPVAYTYSRSEPLERTYNIVAVRNGYAMLLAQGYMRYSMDLRTWSAPRKVLEQDLGQNRLLRSSDGTIWAVHESTSTELHPFNSEEDQLHGFFVVDGKRYRHATDLHVSRSLDGIAWEPAGSLSVPGQPGGLWAFVVGERLIGIALAFNNLTMKSVTTSVSGERAFADVELPFMQQSDQAECFVRDGALTCARSIGDPARQTPMILMTSSDRVWRGAPKR